MNLLKFPHSAMFVGVMACGKTEFLLRLLETIYNNHFEFIVILCPTISDNKTYLSRKWILMIRTFLLCVTFILIDNIFVQFGGRLFRQVIGIPMGTNCAPLLADLFLYSYENEFLDNMIRSGHRRLARSFNLCYGYIDDLIVFNNKKFLDYLKEIYPSQLTVEKANKSDHLADYLDLTFIIDSGGKLSTRLYDKCDDFDFHIVNFPFLSSNIPSGPSYGVYISQLIRYARCCSHYDDFRYRHKCLVDRLLSQGYKALRLEKSFKKFYGRYQDLIEKYRRSVNAMVSDSFPGQFLFNM